MTTQHAEITFEIEETVVMRLEPKVQKVFCPACQAFTLMAPPHAAADISGLSKREIFRLIEAGTLHFSEIDRVLICISSINTRRSILCQNRER